MFLSLVDGMLTSNFGTRSFFNGAPGWPHAGVDFMSGTGTLDSRGRQRRRRACRTAVFHRQHRDRRSRRRPLFPVRTPLRAFRVAKGDAVAPDTIVGLVGATGRGDRPAPPLECPPQRRPRRIRFRWWRRHSRFVPSCAVSLAESVPYQRQRTTRRPQRSQRRQAPPRSNGDKRRSRIQGCCPCVFGLGRVVRGTDLCVMPAGRVRVSACSASSATGPPARLPRWGPG